MAGNAGKGSGRRPSQVPQDQVAQNWELAFGKKKKEEQPASQETKSTDTI